jgi:hypothetical protein
MRARVWGADTCMLRVSRVCCQQQHKQQHKQQHISFLHTGVLRPHVCPGSRSLAIRLFVSCTQQHALCCCGGSQNTLRGSCVFCGRSCLAHKARQLSSQHTPLLGAGWRVIAGCLVVWCVCRQLLVLLCSCAHVLPACADRRS